MTPEVFEMLATDIMRMSGSANERAKIVGVLSTVYVIGKSEAEALRRSSADLRGYLAAGGVMCDGGPRV